MLLIALAVLAAGLATPAQDEFARYSVPVQPGSARVKLHRRTAWSRHYRSELTRQAQQPVDFAGHYVLAVIGCGAECLTIGAIDRLNGNVVELSPTVCCWPDDVTLPFHHHANSRLLVLEGKLNEAGGAGPHRFVLRHGAFERLSAAP